MQQMAKEASKGMIRNVKLQVTISPKIDNLLQQLAEVKGLSKSAIVALAISALAKQEKIEEEDQLRLI